MAAISSGYFLICLVKLSVGFVFSTDGWEDAVAGASPVTPFSAENNVPGVSSVV